MKKLAIGIAATTCLVLVGCGAGPSGQAPSNNGTTGSGQAVASVTNSTGNDPTNAAGGGNDSAALTQSLQPYKGFTAQGISVSVPTGWDPTIKSGGDYRAVTFANPTDAQEQVRVTYSTCVGCYMDSAGKPNPTLVISEKQPTNVKVSPDNPRVASYDFTNSGNPYSGQGQVQVSSNQTGYAEIEVILSKSHQTLADAILKSFSYSS